MTKYKMPFQIKGLVFIALQFMLVCVIKGQDTTTRRPISAFSTEFALRLHYGFIYANSKFVQNTAGTDPRGFDFEISKQFTDKKNWDNYRCYPRMGFAFTYFDYNLKILGKSYSASYFLEPNYRIGGSSSFFMRGAAGLSYLTNPFDSVKNPTNQSYSLPVNIFLSFGLGLNFKLSNHIGLGIMASFQHNSNGGLQLPNHGVNYPTGSLVVRYSPAGGRYPVYPKVKTFFAKNSKPTVDVGVFGAAKSGFKSQGEHERKTVEGVYVQVGKQVTALDAFTLMAEVYYDDAMASIKRVLKDNTPSTLVGIMAGHEFIFHRVLFSQQLGAYVYKDTKTFVQEFQAVFPTVYHRWGLRYKFNSHLQAGFNLLAHNQVADFIDARVSYRF